MFKSAFQVKLLLRSLHVYATFIQILLLLLLLVAPREPRFFISGRGGGRVRGGRRRLRRRALQRRKAEAWEPRYEVSDCSRALPQIQGGQVRGMGGTGEKVIGGVDRRAAGRASVGGGTANCSLVVVQCWALS